jgi:hypothetical protein
VREPVRGFVADATSLDLAIADVNDAAQECACGQHDGAGADLGIIGKANTNNLPTLHDQIGDFALDNPETGLLGQKGLDRRLVQGPVGLGAGAPYGRTFPAIEQAELDTGPIGSKAHDPAQCIDFTDKMTFSKAANRRIARHHTNRVCPHRQKSGLGTDACGRMRRFGAGMAATDHDDVEALVFHVKHSLLSDAKL